MNRRAFIGTLASGLLAAPLAAGAQPAGKLPRVGYLSNSARYDEPDTGFFAGLREHGYEPDRNILVEARYSAGRPDRNREFAADLVRLRCRVIVAWGPPVVAEITRLTASIPIIAISHTDFVVLGWAETFARPGGNITGFMVDAGELNAKRFELLKEVVPTLGTVAFLQNPTRPGTEADLAEGTRAARTLKLKTELFTVSAPEQFERAFAQMVRHRVDGLLVLPDTMFYGYRTEIVAAEAQQAGKGKVYRIGIVTSTAHFTDSFRQGLRELGYVEGQNVIVEQRSTQGQSDRFPELVAEMIRLKVDVLVVSGVFGVLAAKKATTTVPIVFLGVGDPVASGIVASLARPGGNITGTSIALGEGFAGKWVELLKEASPRASHVAVLWNSTNPTAAIYLKELQSTAQAVHVRLDLVDVRNLAELDGSFAAIEASRARGLIVTADPLFFSNRTKLLRFASTKRLPAIYFFRDFVDDGGLMAYGPSLADAFRRAATYVDRIIRGASPADLPVEQPTKFELLINLKTAKVLGLTIPQSLLQRADQVIE